MNSFGRKNNDNTENKEKNNKILTKETFGMTFILFATLAMICLITRELVFGSVGKAINGFLLGAFGHLSFVYLLGLMALGVYFVIGKKRFKLGKKYIYIISALLLIALLIHSITTTKLDVSTYGKYLKGCFTMGDKGAKGSSFGGVLFGLISYIFVSTIGFAGTYAVISVFIALFIYLIVKSFFGINIKKAEKPHKISLVSNEKEDMQVKEYPAFDNSLEKDEKAKLFYRQDDFQLKTKKQFNDTNKKAESFKILYPNKSGDNNGLSYGESTKSQQTYSNIYGEEMKKKLDYIKKPSEIKLDDISDNWKSQTISRAIKAPETPQVINTEINNQTNKETKSNEDNLPPIYTHEEAIDFSEKPDETKKRFEEFSRYAEIEETENIDNDNLNIQSDNKIDSAKKYEENEEFDYDLQGTNIPLVDNEEDFGYEETKSAPEIQEKAIQEISSNSFERPIKNNFETKKEEKKVSISENSEEPINRVYYRPPIDLFKIYKQDINSPKENHEERAAIIERTLSEFGIDAKVVNYVQGPTVTRYEIMMPAGVSVKKVPIHADDIAMRLESENGVRIEAPIPGKNLVGIEVPNKAKTMVGLRDIIESEEFNRDKKGALTFAIGKDIIGNCICDNIAKAPHYLVAGATGMGKSVCLNSMIISLITKYSPEELRLILIDPKQVEFTIYNHLPHLMIDEIITSAPKAIATLQWAVDEMENRYATFRINEVRDINEYNDIIASDTVPKIPKLVIIVDEVSDLMLYAKRDLESKIVSISQKARAAGIHLVLATQRPSVDVITGVIKANLPSRIAFRVSNSIDSNVILSESGAEKLLGNGDMLYKNSVMPKCERYQGAFIDTPEVKNIVAYIKEHNKAYFNDKAASEIEKTVNPPEPTETDNQNGEEDLADDKLFVEALKLVITTGSASISMLQRRFSVGYAKAGGLIDKMDRKGYITPFDGSRARQVLITKEEFEKTYGEL